MTDVILVGRGSGVERWLRTAQDVCNSHGEVTSSRRKTKIEFQTIIYINSSLW